jgi:hypothetical protein
MRTKKQKLNLKKKKTNQFIFLAAGIVK